MGEFVTIAAHREGSGRADGERRYTTASGRTLWIHNDDVMSEEGHGSYTEPAVTERVSQLVVTYMDGSTSKHDAPEGTMLDSRGYLRVVGGPTINVANVRFWQLEKP